MSELVRIEHLSKSFGRRPVLRDLGFALEPGKVYGLLGRNGEGKTTLIRTLMGVIPHDSGVISFKGRPVTFGAAHYKQRIGYIPEDPFFYGGMTVRGLLAFNGRFYPEVTPAGRPPTSAARARSGREDPDSFAGPAPQAGLRRRPGRRTRAPGP